MPPLRTMPTIKPTKTERSHEENQERAYIAASRRSDRSLEARVESARRASEIHEKRTGRKLRVTEQDVINEEMYEEEDDNVPWRYRHLSLLPNLSTLSPEFRRRVEAQLVLEMERARMVDPNAQFQSPGPYLNSSMMQMQANSQSPLFGSSMFQFGQQTPGLSSQTPGYPQLSPGLQPQQHSRSPSTHRPSPYGASNAEQRGMKQSPHQRSASIANPQASSTQRKHHSQSSRTLKDSRSPDDAKPPSLSRTTSGQSPTSENSHPSSAEDRVQAQRHNSFGGPFHSGANQGYHNPYAPLTSTLPMNTQQLLGDGMFGFMDDPSSGMMKPNAMGMNQLMFGHDMQSTQQNSKKRSHADMTTSSGLDQTLMPTALDTNVNDPSKRSSYNAPYSAGSSYLDSALSEPDYGFGFNQDDFNLDLFKSSQSSGQRTPGEFTNFINDDFFTDQQYGY